MGSQPKTIGLLTSGGDAPGMNACIRAIVRTAVFRGLRILGYRFGYVGLIAGDYRPLDGRSVSNIIQRGGTILGTSRCKEFETEEGRRKAAEGLRSAGVDALLVIGGEGSLKGAREFAAQWDGRIIGLPGTIDNDLGGTDWTIGFYTALETALDSIDKIRDTAEAFDRVFLIEVMGRLAGDIALGVGIAGGAEEILVPEMPEAIETVARRVVEAKSRGKLSYIIVVAEGFCKGGAIEVAKRLSEITSLSCTSCVLGHTQRGGSPVAPDRILGTRLGIHAVEAAIDGATGVMVGEVNGAVKLTKFEDLGERRRVIDPAYWEKFNVILRS
jgi:6-phosphofructokinase 1